MHAMKVKRSVAPCFIFIPLMSGICRLNAIVYKVNFLFVVFPITGTGFFSLHGFHFFDAFVSAFIAFPL